MTWQEKILHRISEDSSRPQIVIDQTKILLQEGFQSILKEKEINYRIVDNINELIKVEKEQYSLC